MNRQCFSEILGQYDSAKVEEMLTWFKDETTYVKKLTELEEQGAPAEKIEKQKQLIQAHHKKSGYVTVSLL